MRTTTIISSVASFIGLIAMAVAILGCLTLVSQSRGSSHCPPSHCHPHNAGCCCGPTCPCPPAVSPGVHPRVPPRGSIDTSDDADGTAEGAADAEEQERNRAICIDGQCCPADTQVTTARGPAGTSGETPRNGAFACERCKSPTVGRDWHEIWAGDTSLLCVCKTCWGQMRPPERQSVLTQYAQRTGKSNDPDVQRVISSLAR